jgi:hypothetical protein
MVRCRYEHSKAGGAAVKSYVFRVAVEDDAMETGEKAYHAYCPALKGATRGGAPTTKPWRMSARQSSCTLRIYGSPDLEFRSIPS